MIKLINDLILEYQKCPVYDTYLKLEYAITGINLKIVYYE